MDEWNKLVEEKWNYWEYYRDLFDFRISKAANSIFTRTLYPVFYQQSLLKKEFVENMQLLGDLLPEEVTEYTSLTHITYLDKSFSYHRNPSRWLHGFYGYEFVGVAAAISLTAMATRKTFGFKVVIPTMFLFFSAMCLHKYFEKKLVQIVDMTQWALEKRKAEVWLQELKGVRNDCAGGLPNLLRQIPEIVYGVTP